MWRAAVAGSIVLGLITPGVALAVIQQWTPVILALATMAGTALALAGAAYSKAHVNAVRVATLEKKLPRRSTDVTPTAPPSGVPAMPVATGRAAVVDYTTAILPQEGVAK